MQFVVPISIKQKNTIVLDLRKSSGSDLSIFHKTLFAILELSDLRNLA